MIDIPGTLAQMIKSDIPEADFSLSGTEALMVSSKCDNADRSLMMFSIQGGTLIVPTWVMNQNVFRHVYDLANPEDLNQFVNSLRLALSDIPT